jgi:hypothetical protein
MTESETTGEERLRQLFRQAAVQIHPLTPGPGFDTRPTPIAGATTVRRSLGVALCVLVAAAITFAVHPWGATHGAGLGDAGGIDGVLVTVASNGAVELQSPESGAVLSTLVGPSPVDTSGRHLGEPVAVTADTQFAYVGYERPSPVIESIPLSGGTPTYVAAGMDPAVSPDGTELAYASVASNNSDVVVRDLATGAQQTVDLSSGAALLNALSWSPDGTELALSGTFIAAAPKTLSPGTIPDLISQGVELLRLNQPLTAANPHFVGTPVDLSGLQAGTPAWSDAQFLGSTGAIVVLRSGSGGACPAGPSSLVSVDPTTGATTTVASFAYLVSDPVFDQSGDLLAFQRDFVSCPAVTTTTSTTSTTTTTVPGRFGGSVSIGGGSITNTVTGGGFITNTVWENWANAVLYKWSDGTASRLAGGVRAVTFVDQAPGATS